MNADIITSATHPHGTPAGYLAGCRGSHCPSVLSCRDVHRRHSGDFTFRRMFDSGVSVAEIVAQEEAAARAVAEAERAARRVPPKPKVDRRPAANRAKAKPLIPRDQLAGLLAEGLTDRQIAERLGLERRQVTHTRNNAGMERNPDQKGSRLPSIDLRLHEVEGLSDEDAAVFLNRTARYIHRRRLIVAKKKRETA